METGWEFVNDAPEEATRRQLAFRLAATAKTVNGIGMRRRRLSVAQLDLQDAFQLVVCWLAIRPKVPA